MQEEADASQNEAQAIDGYIMSVVKRMTMRNGTTNKSVHIDESKNTTKPTQPATASATTLQGILRRCKTMKHE